MAAATFRSRAKAAIPGPLRAPLRRLETYGRRLAMWAGAMREVRGVHPADRAILMKSFLNSPFDSIRDLDRWRDPALLADAEVEVAGVGRFRVRGASDDFYHVLPSRESAIVDAIRERVGPGGVFVDAGANIGFYTVLAGRCAGPAGQVIAIEMLPETAAILRGHVDANGLGNVRVVERALCDRDGGELSAHVVEGRFGQASVAERSGAGQQVAVPTATLATVLAGVARVDLMKMDLEGAEVPALRGALPILPRINAIIFETRARDDEASALLAGAGFAIRQLDGRNAIATKGAAA